VIAPRRIVVGLTGKRWGGVAQLVAENPLLRAHVVIGSPYPHESTDEAQRSLDGRVEIGAEPTERDDHLLLLMVSDGTPGSVTREQIMTAVRICAMWRGQYRGDRGKIPLQPTKEIESGEHFFDIDALRSLLHNWEQSRHSMRGFPSRYAVDH
jgi:hypothetical protein